jgi:hypothetical protein
MGLGVVAWVVNIPVFYSVEISPASRSKHLAYTLSQRFGTWMLDRTKYRYLNDMMQKLPNILPTKYRYLSDMMQKLPNILPTKYRYLSDMV